MNDYDDSIRQLLRLEPAALLGWFVPGLNINYRFVGWLDPQLTDQQRQSRRIADTVAELVDSANRGAAWALVIETQTGPSPEMLGRLLVYLGLVWIRERPDTSRASRYQLAGLVINLTGTPASVPARADFAMQTSPPLILRHEPREVHLAVMDGEAVVADIAADRAPLVVLPLVPLMQSSAIEQLTQDWLVQLQRVTDDAKRNTLIRLTRVLANLR